MAATVDLTTPEAQAKDGKLRGRVAFVTGGTRGIGSAICHSLASQGAAVAAGYAGRTERAQQFQEKFLEQWEPSGVKSSIHQGDVGNPDDCRRTVQEVIDAHGRLDILVNNAGITIDKTALKLTDDDWRRVIDVNLSGAFYMSQAALRHMIEQGSGRIINISSVIGQMGNIGQANYAASKAGMFGLTRTLAREAAFALERAGKLAEDGVGITVNAVTPGFIATEMLDAVPEKVLDGIKKQIPVRRLGRADEIARVVHFLAADASSYITGQIWGVNGGMDM